jgi:hypothetical protein
VLRARRPPAPPTTDDEPRGEILPRRGQRAGTSGVMEEVFAMMHEIIEAKGETTSASAETRLGDFNKRRRMEELLRRYPGTADDETARIRHFLAKGTHLDVGLVGGSDELGEKVRRFRTEHSRHLRPKPHDAVVPGGHYRADRSALLAVSLMPEAISNAGFGRPGAACFTSSKGGC